MHNCNSIYHVLLTCTSAAQYTTPIFLRCYRFWKANLCIPEHTAADVDLERKAQKKLGPELADEFIEALKFLGHEEKLRVVVEPQAFKEHIQGRTDMDFVCTFDPAEKSRLAERVDFVICLGGDGVILHASSLFQKNSPPVIAFNLGSLGFMTNHLFKDFRADLHDVIYGNSVLSTCMVKSAGQSIDANDENQEVYRWGMTVPSETFEVLNEVVVDRGANSYLTNIECYERDRFLTRVQADGIILSTPTGSTAYAVSAGGSMVHPNVPAIVFAPVCPHSLSFRPVVLPDYVDLELRIPVTARAGGRVSFDGRNSMELCQGDRLRVRMSENPLPTINKVDLTEDWFDSLSRCFRWSDRLEQKAFRQPTKTVDTVADQVPKTAAEKDLPVTIDA
eukprot:gene27000-9018_t